MIFFEKKDVNSYIGEKQKKMAQEILAFKDADIVNCDFEEWAEYFVSKYYIEPITLFNDNIEKKITETKVKRYNHWSGISNNVSEFHMIDGYSITFTIPFDGDEELLYLKPSTYIMTRFEASSMQRPKNDLCGSFTIEFTFTAKELTEQPDMNEFVMKKFEREYENYKKMIQYLNEDIENYNNMIKKNAVLQLEARKKKASDFVAISHSLNIPLKLNTSSPNIAPIHLQKVVRKPVTKPTAKPAPIEYCISDEDYKNIVNIIHNCCSSMEATARTFVKTGEEELRDFILATLGTHYVDMVTGETFRKIGKTDIHIVFDNKAAFIGECKIWHGIKNFESAIEQLFGYSTWKDTKTALIIFNKENKDFASIQKGVNSWIKTNAKQYKVVNGNVWSCVLHQVDTNTDVQVAIALYDITV